MTQPTLDHPALSSTVEQPVLGLEHSQAQNGGTTSKGYAHGGLIAGGMKRQHDDAEHKDLKSRLHVVHAPFVALGAAPFALVLALEELLLEAIAAIDAIPSIPRPDSEAIWWWRWA